MQKRCLGCMAEFEEQYNICPYCGYVEQAQESGTESVYLRPGTILNGRYMVGKVLGAGGFGVTYIGWDTALEEKIAIKEYLPGDFATRAPGEASVSIFGGVREEQFQKGLERFHEEAVSLAKFNIPGVVGISDCVYENQTAYIIMEFLDGMTAKEILAKKGTLPFEEVLNIMVPALRTLEAVHQQGLIHRDIAPDNIFITKTGEVKLIDFGAARYATTEHSRSLSVVLKPGYAPEEQYHSKGEQGPWTDVYASAATIYRMLTGVIPPVSLERQAKDTLKDPAQLGAEVPEYAKNAILNALNVSIRFRTQSAAAFMNDLISGAEVARVIDEDKPKPVGVKRWVKITGAAAAALLVLFVVLMSTGTVQKLFNPAYVVSALPEGIVETPYVTGMEYEVAQAEVKNTLQMVIGYTMDVEDEYYAEKYPKSTILDQTPIAGTPQKLNSELVVIISAGKPQVFVPELTGMTKDLARQELVDMGFEVTESLEYSETIAKDAVIRLDPEHGASVDKGSTIDMVVSNGSQNIDASVVLNVPNIVGMDLDKATAQLKKDNLFIAVSKRTNDPSIPNNQITAQTPSNGTVHAGDTIQVTVNITSQKGYMPDVIYRTRVVAQSMLDVLGLKVSFVEQENRDVQAGTVFKQSIAVGTPIKTGMAVTLTVSKGYQATVPNVVNRDESSAMDEIYKAGLTYSVSREPNQAANGTVLRQTPAGGQKVSLGSNVELTVSSGPAPAVTTTTAAPQPTSLYIETMPNKREYTVGESFDKTGLKVMLYYTDSSSKDVTGNCSFSGFSSAKAGTSTITVSYNSSLKTTFDVAIKEVPTAAPVKVTSIQISASSTSIEVGKPLQLNATVLPQNAANRTINWSVTNHTGSASINKTSGLLTATGAGTVTVTAAAGDDSGTIGTTVITITIPEYTITFCEHSSQRTKTVKAGESVTMPAHANNTFTITYNANGGTVSPGSKTVTQLFSGWKSPGRTLAAGASFVPTGNETFACTFGTAALGDLPTPNKAGSTFDGWEVNGSKVSAATPATGNMTLIASWTAETYSVSYNGDGAIINLQSHTGVLGDTFTVRSLGAVSPLPRPSLRLKDSSNQELDSRNIARQFRCWLDSKTGDTYFAGATYRITGNSELKAIWSDTPELTSSDMDVINSCLPAGYRWSLDLEGTQPVTFSVGYSVPSNMTVYAVAIQ
jgi:beta-lactam-binding protein with PASTA domain/serine/threonine protein kinase